MAKIRKTGSIENGIMQVLKILNDEEINNAIGKGSSYLRKCSNPALPQQLDHNDSIKLEFACNKKMKTHPLFTAHEFILINQLKRGAASSRPLRVLYLVENGQQNNWEKVCGLTTTCFQHVLDVLLESWKITRYMLLIFL